jgi:hypothetical protein
LLSIWIWSWIWSEVLLGPGIACSEKLNQKPKHYAKYFLAGANSLKLLEVAF